MREVSISVLVTLVLGFYLAVDFVQPVARTGWESVAVLWWDLVTSTLQSCGYHSLDALWCPVGALLMLSQAPGLPYRVFVVMVGAAVSGLIVHLSKGRDREPSAKF